MSKHRFLFIVAAVCTMLWGCLIRGAMGASLPEETLLATPAPDDLTADAAKEIAKEAILATYNVTVDSAGVMDCTSTFLSFEIEGKKEKAWHFTFHYGGAPEHTVTVLSPSGSVYESANTGIEAIRAELEKDRGPVYFWSLAQQEIFYQLYEKRSIGDWDAGQPDENDIPPEKAVAIAKSELANTHAISEADLSDKRVAVSYVVLRETGEHFYTVTFRTGEDHYPIYQVDIAADDGTVLQSFAEDGSENYHG